MPSNVAAVATVLLSLQTWHTFKLQPVQPLVAVGGAVEEYNNQQELGLEVGLRQAAAAQRRVVGFGRARSSLLLLTAATTTKARDDKSEDRAWNDPCHCWIHCHIGRRTTEATEEAEDDGTPPSAAATGEK